MKARRLRILLSVMLAIPIKRAAAEHPWVQVQSPHFTIICNGSEKDGREAAVDLERMRVVLITALPSIRQDPNVPVIVFVTADENMFATLVPTYWQRPQGSRSNSSIQTGRDRNYIVMRVAFRMSSEYQLKFDYAALIASINFPRAPLWFRAGFAEFFAFSEIENDKAKVGMPSTRYAQRIQHAPLIPLPRFFAVRNNSTEYTDPEVRWNFDAESWGLFHYLLLGDKGAHRAQLENYLDLLSHGKRQLDAAQEAYGDLGKLQDKLGPYYAQKGFPFAQLELPREGYAEQLTVRTLPQSESNAWLAECHLRSKRQPEAKALIDAALAANPNEPRAHEAQGLYDLEKADYEGALKELSTASAGDASLYLSHYYKGILSSYWKSPPEIPESSERDLRRSVDLMPRYAPASLAVARLIARKGGNLTDAKAFARAASESEPGSPRYALAYANILLLAGDGNQAETQARQLLERELSSLEKESATAILKLAQDCKPGGPCKGLGHLEFGAASEPPVAMNSETSASGASAADPPTSLYRLEGVMRKIGCTTDGRAATLASGEKDITYAMAKATRVTWPETFWLDSTYLDVCEHFAGEPAAIDFKGAQADSTPPEATAVRIQDRF
jgi:hypothetical protein